MLELIKTNSENIDFKNLVIKLDRFLKITDGDDHDFYNQYNGLDNIKHVLVAYHDKTPVGCAAFKPFDNNTVEIKRMFTTEAARGKGVASAILKQLEVWAKQLNYTHSILETGIRQIEAVNFYKKCNYQIIDNYGQYKGIKESICFKKAL
ncbi:GNAT family N-acetyltransferase [Olleya namhaensis]|uniref:Acetyltransferase (GNAT) family protein n=1 Tax=Olleya namhaensis TaxID=1144750 RepID=A0A1I3N8U6_9FLAO|nr:GNAT family N-acetyltransferase [Olleya namhaensis]SFJ05246.1 Acetyltransferase (GNAT) family protein [Olleya namhaensis]